MRNFLDPKSLTWPLTPQLEVGKKIGEFTLYLSPEIPIQKITLMEMFQQKALQLDKKQWAAYFKQLSQDLDPPTNLKR
ncbi:hypothetical protein ACU5EH_23525 [Aliivibrio salmonicida]|uniref:hypothetical protein n=1 Tax=Aliivibrio salmonicida TaxID=40269 RepID=UPI00406CA8F1